MFIPPSVLLYFPVGNFPCLTCTNYILTPIPICQKCAVFTAWLDLENLVYRPLLEHVLPFIGILLGRICDSAVDGIIVLLRKTLYKDANIPYRTGTLPKLETVLGTLLDKGESYLKRQEEAMSYRWSIRRKRLAHQESRDMIRFSLSYGLSLSGIGLIFVLIYLFL